MAKITRREMIKRALYLAPVILTLTAVPALASKGSGNQSSSSNWSPNWGESKSEQGQSKSAWGQSQSENKWKND